MPSTVTVASVPAAHVYVQHLQPDHPDDLPGRVVRLPDPDPDVPHRSAVERWWPPAMLSPQWIRRHDFDVFHIQFGFDAWDPDDLHAVLDALRERGKPLVYTVHDLRNPHHPDRRLHDAQLDVLVRRADALITLTAGAAAEIRRRWGREAVVLPHPHVVDFATMERLASRSADPSGPFRVGVHIKSLRHSMAPGRLLPDLVQAVASLPDAVLQVNGHRDVLDPDGNRRDHALATYLDERSRAGDLELHVHDFLPDAELWAYLAALDVSVLPYRFGTHSGWLEACRDLGTAVVAPSCGYFADQGPVHTYCHDEDAYDGRSLQEAVCNAYAAGSPEPLPVAGRRTQRQWVAAAHLDLYRSLL